MSRGPRTRPAVSYGPQDGRMAYMDRPDRAGLPGSRGLEGASVTSREMATWRPSMASPDRIINTVKDLVDARGRDVAQNDGAGQSAVQVHRNSIVGARYVLNARPRWRVLGGSEAWAEEFQQVAEDRFNLYAESDSKWLDASRKLTFTGIIRLAVGGFVLTGEALGAAEWIKEADRPYKTAYQSVAPARLSNPNGTMDTPTMRRGVEKDLRGKPLAYHIRGAYPGDLLDERAFVWRRVPAATPWGRRQIVHITDPLEPDQTRGISDMVAVLKEMRMTRRFQDVTLQNAVVNATYAAAIESELPGEVIAAAMGGGGGSSYESAIVGYLDALEGYVGKSNNLRMDGVMIPHLFPNTKLSLKPAGTPGGVGTDFEASLQRHVAAGLGISYEEFTRDFSKLSYSGGRLSLAVTDRFMAARKRLVADGLANALYALWLEEELNLQNLPPLPGKSRKATLDLFYQPLMKEAFCEATWIGASAGQVDPLKETQAALMRIASGLSTREDECAALGKDFRLVDEQQAREHANEAAKGLVYSTDAKRSLTGPTDNPGDPGQGDNVP